MARYKEIELALEKKAEEEKRLQESLTIDARLQRALPESLRYLSRNKMPDSKKLDKGPHSLKALLKPLMPDKKSKDPFDELKRKKAIDILEVLCSKNSFRMMEEFHDELNRIIRKRGHWLRDLSQWRVTSHNPGKQFRSLINHLFCLYPVPEFMYQAWSEPDQHMKHIDWFIQMAKGESIRDLKGCPVKLSKKAAHAFSQTPVHYTISDAVRRAQVIGLGGNDQLADAILCSQLRDDFKHPCFWESVFAFFVTVRNINYGQVGPVLDYISHVKFRSRQIPDFSVKGRTMNSLMRDVHNWHLSLQRSKYGGVEARWTGRTLEPFIITEGVPETSSYRVYEIVEITNGRELLREGASMNHCVFTYAKRCQRNECNIFSLRLNRESIVTMEMREGKRIVQIRGPKNSVVEKKYMNIIEQWASKENLDIAQYANRR